MIRKLMKKFGDLLPNKAVWIDVPDFSSNVVTPIRPVVIDPECQCMHPPFHYTNYQKSKYLGVDKTNGRFGKVTVEECKFCGSKWLDYHVEYSGFSKSGRWYRGLINNEIEAQLRFPSSAVGILNHLQVRFEGGSYFGSSGRASTGRLRVDG